MKRDLRMFKYPLFDMQHAVLDDIIEISMPLTFRRPGSGTYIGMQDGVVTLWTLIDVNGAREKRRFYIAGTGQALPPESCYLGTVFDRQFVWHIFELL